MRTLLYIIAAIIAAGSGTMLMAKGHSRHYIEVVSCDVQKGKIVVSAKDGLYELKRLRTDAKGAYVCPSDIIFVHKEEASETHEQDHTKS